MRYLARIGLTLTTGALTLSPVFGVTSSTATPTARSPLISSTTVITPIPPDEISTRAETLADQLRSIASSLSSDAIVMNVQADYPVFAREVHARLAEDGKLLRSKPSLQTLRDLEFGLTRYSDAIDDWNRDLAKRAEQLNKLKTSLQIIEQTWEATLSQSTGPQTPADVMQTIQTSIASVRQTLAAIDQQNRTILMLQNRMAETDRRLDEMMDEVREAHSRFLERLLHRDSPPLWGHPIENTVAASSLIQEGQTSLSNEVKALTAYLEREENRLLLHFLVIIGLILGLLWIRRRAHTWTQEEPALGDTFSLFESPTLVALVLSILVSGWIYPQPPRLLWSILGTLALIPTTLLLKKLIDAPLYPLLYALTVIYFVDEIRSMTATLPLVSRWLVFFESLGAVFFLIWQSRSAAVTPGNTARQRQSRIILWLARMAYATLILGLLANLLGYVNLAVLLGDAVLSSAFAAVILYASLEILDGLLMIALRSPPLSLLGVVRKQRPLIWTRISRFFVWVAILWWSLFTLDRLALREPLGTWTFNVLNTSFTVGSFTVTPGHVLAFIITVWAAFLISRFIRFLLEEDVYPRLGLAPGLPHAISTVLHYLIVVAGFLMAVAMLGFDMTKFTILASAFGVGLGFGLQNVSNNFISGLILLFERPVKVGDMVQIDDTEGWVSQIGIRATKIRTSSGSLVVIPNGTMLSTRVVNWTATSQQRSVDIDVTVAASANPTQVIALLEQVAVSHPLIVKNPPPKALLVKLTAAGLNFELRAWTDHLEERLNIRSELVLAINTALAKEKIPVQ